MLLFQSTLPRGERHRILKWICTIKLFQSTLPRGERHAPANTSATTSPFQSTLPRGERPSKYVKIRCYFRFQSTLPRGERRKHNCQPGNYCSISIHAPARGATPALPRIRSQSTYFNPRSREGSDDRWSSGCGSERSISIRSREGSDSKYN